MDNARLWMALGMWVVGCCGWQREGCIGCGMGSILDSGWQRVVDGAGIWVTVRVAGWTWVVVSGPGGGCGWRSGHGVVEGYASHTWNAGNQLSLEILLENVGKVFAFHVKTQCGIPFLICILSILGMRLYIVKTSEECNMTPYKTFLKLISFHSL